MADAPRLDPLEEPGREYVKTAVERARQLRVWVRRAAFTKAVGYAATSLMAVVGIVWGGVVGTLPWVLVGVAVVLVTYSTAVALRARRRVLNVEAAADARVRAAEDGAADQQQQDARVRVHLDVKLVELEQRAISSQDAIDNATLYLLGDRTARRALMQRDRPFIPREPAADLMKAAAALRAQIPAAHPEPLLAATRRAAPPEPPDLKKVKARVRRNEVTLARLNAEAQTKAVPRNAGWAQRLSDAVADEDYVKKVEVEEGLSPKRRAAAKRADEEAERRAALGLPPMPRPGDHADQITIRLDPKAGPTVEELPERRTPQELAADLDGDTPRANTG